jgi:hypothetical protein
VRGRVEIRLQRDGRWRWRYREAAAVIPSNRDFARFDDAVAAARRAYPGVHLIELRPRLVTVRVAAIAAAVLVFVLLGRSSRGSR